MYYETYHLSSLVRIKTPQSTDGRQQHGYFSLMIKEILKKLKPNISKY